MPLNFFSGFFGIKLQKSVKIFSKPLVSEYRGLPSPSGPPTLPPLRRTPGEETNPVSIYFPTPCHFGRLWYGEPDAISCAKFFSRSHDAVVRIYDGAGNVIETHDHVGDSK
jgi:hypothetical protein